MSNFKVLLFEILEVYTFEMYTIQNIYILKFMRGKILYASKFKILNLISAYDLYYVNESHFILLFLTVSSMVDLWANGSLSNPSPILYVNGT